MPAALTTTSTPPKVVSAAVRREQQRERMRGRLPAAALELFEAQGFGATTIDQIAERADVARQTVLNHYPTKKDFVAAWGERRRNELAAIEQTSTESTRDGLRRMMNALAEINMREKRLTQQLREQRVVPQPVPEAMLRILREGRRKGEIARSVDPQVAAELVAAVYFDTLSRWLIDDEPGFDLRQALNARLDLLLSGLAAEFPRHDDRFPGLRRGLEAGKDLAEQV
jgi:AcrR family transcriptional regulator